MIIADITRVQSKITKWKEALLDGSRTNQLLYFKGADARRGANAVQLYGHEAALYAKLSKEQKQSELITPEMLGIASLDPEASPEDIQARQEQSDRIIRRLKRLHERARDAQNNQGITILFAACGILQWREAETSEEVIRSPLVLIPVDLKSMGSWTDEYRIERIAEGRVVLNPTLCEKLRHDFGIQLPVLTDDGKIASNGTSISLAEILEHVRLSYAQVRAAQSWSVLGEIYLGLFTFQRQALYDDLTSNYELAAEHPIIKAICGDGALSTPDGPIIPAEELDRRVLPEETWQVLDADASQQEAIIAAKHGQSFVLQGPPGTGKSQTIANIIAECIAAGKKILFVSEKMAAIEVVQKRLADVGLDPFCLNLHHRGTGKGEKERVYETLKAALIAAPLASSYHEQRWREAVMQVSRTRQHLNEYVEELHRRRSSLYWSAFEAYGKIAAHQETPDVSCKLPDPAQMTPDRLQDIRDALETLSSYCDLLANAQVHPWRHTLLREFTPSIQASMRATYGDLIEYLTFTATESVELGKILGIATPIEHEAATRDVLDLAMFTLSTPHPVAHWLHPDEIDRLIEMAAEAQQQQQRLQAAQTRVFATYRSTIVSQDIPLWETLADALESSPAEASVKGLDTFLQQESRWREQLTAIRGILPDLVTTSAAVAKLCGLAEPTSLSECGAFSTLAALLAETPCPPKSWLDAELFRHVRNHFTALERTFRRLQGIQSQLQVRYTQQIMRLDPSIRERFRSSYGSLFRYARPTWYQDRAQIRACLIPGQPLPGLAVLLHDLDLAQEAAMLEHQLVDEMGYNREQLEPFSTDGSVDWVTIHAQMAWVDLIFKLAREWDWEITPEMCAFAAKPQRHWAEFTAQQQRLADLWQRWEALALTLQETFDMSRFTHATALPDASPAVVSAQIEALQAALAPIWTIAQTLTEHRRATQPLTWAELRQVIRDGTAIIQGQHWLEQRQTTLQTAFTTWHTGHTTDWDRIRAALAWCQDAIQRHHGTSPPDAFIALVSATEQDAVSLHQVEDSQRRLTGHLKKLNQLWLQSDAWLPRSIFQSPEREMLQTPYVIMRQGVQRQMEALPQMERWIAFRQCRERCAALDLVPFIEALTQALDTQRVPWIDHHERKTAWAIFEKCFHQAWLTTWIHTVPALETFQGYAHEQTIHRFQSADIEHLKQSRKRLANELFQRRRKIQARLNEFDAALLELRRQVSLKRRKSLRKLIELTGPAMCELMSCWMMSPLSVSEYINPHTIYFDVVIFDEASQICAEDAISSIMRGRQLIVVGDEKQLPPTNIFRKLLSLDDTEEDTDEEQEAQPQESILKECAGVMPSRMLRFHYRSRHEALIAFSNAHFYGDALVTFPSARAEHSEGLQFVFVEDGVYDRGGSRTNRREAEYVADLVMGYAENQSDSKLGVVAFSAAQQHAIEDEISRRLKDRPDLQPWFNEDNDDAFFVRNLESVQGDERDVIILSVGYGKDKFGKMTQNFGPLNSGGGERRLNVAITRARKKMIVISSIRADDIKGATEGTRALHGYLDFAEHGKAALATAADAHPNDRFDSPFEEEVCRMLRARGCTVDTQVGCSGYRIDMAIRDSERPDRYILGVECDGASYHSAKTARDRDRLRQAQLESLGWKIHRIWSRDWFISPEREIIKVLDRLEDLTASRSL